MNKAWLWGLTKWKDTANTKPIIRPIGIDASTNAIETITYEHHEVHDGRHFFIHDVNDDAINHVMDIQFTTPDTTRWCHLLFEVDSENELDGYIYEGVTIATPGTAVTPLNSNRNSSNTSGATVKKILNDSVALANADTAVAAATELIHFKTGSKSVAGGHQRRANEIILKQNTIYCFRAVYTAAGYCTFNMAWYEHIAKDS